MAKAASKKQEEESSSINQFQQELAKEGLADLLRRVDAYVDLNVHCISTGYPELDWILHPDKRSSQEREQDPRGDNGINVGLPLTRDIEIFSRYPEVGKTTAALQFGANAQKHGHRTAIIDVARTLTEEYLKARGFSLDPKLDDKLPVPYLMRAEDDFGMPLTAEQVFDAVRGASKLFDLVIVDDVAALIQASDLAKDADENSRTGGVAKLITDHMRKTTAKRACVIWVNQQRQQIGGFTRPGMPPRYKSMGGEAIPFFGSIRLDLEMVEKISVGSDANKEFVGMRIKFYAAKNKVAPPFRACTLTYLDDEGFSTLWSYFQLGLKMGLITKNKASHSFGEMRAQGEMNFYKALREDADVQAALIAAIDHQREQQEEDK